MSEEEYLEYSAEGSYDISIAFDVLIYVFIIKNTPSPIYLRIHSLIRKI